VNRLVALKLIKDKMFTRAGDFVGTPGYMSPEQADLN
jgi:hypothetical protein